MGPITVGYQTNESDRGTGTDEDFTAMGVSYQVNDDVAVSYGVSSLDYSSALEDHDLLKQKNNQVMIHHMIQQRHRLLDKIHPSQ
mgnify:CR=1 FL=1